MQAMVEGRWCSTGGMCGWSFPMGQNDRTTIITRKFFCILPVVNKITRESVVQDVRRNNTRIVYPIMLTVGLSSGNVASSKQSNGKG